MLTVALVTAGCAAGPETRNKEVANRVVTEILSGGNYELADELYSPATGKALTGRGITIWRIVDGRIAEEWSAFDQLSIMQQLGLLPPTGQ